MSWDLTGFIVRSKYRSAVFLDLTTAKRPSQISKKLGFRLTHVTRALRELGSKSLVECLNPKDRVGRIYQLTSRGKSLIKKVKDLQ